MKKTNAEEFSWYLTSLCTWNGVDVSSARNLSDALMLLMPSLNRDEQKELLEKTQSLLGVNSKEYRLVHKRYNNMR